MLHKLYLLLLLVEKKGLADEQYGSLKEKLWFQILSNLIDSILLYFQARAFNFLFPSHKIISPVTPLLLQHFLRNLPNNLQQAMGNKNVASSVTLSQAKADNRFDCLGKHGLSRLMNRWCSSQLDALDLKLMSVCKYQKKKYLNLPLFLEFFPNLRKVRHNVQRMYFDFFDLTNSSYVAPKDLVACLSVIMFTPKQQFGEVVLANVFAKGCEEMTEAQVEAFIAENRIFENQYRKVVAEDVLKTYKTISLKTFSDFIATHYNIIKLVRLFDFYQTKLQFDQLTRLKGPPQQLKNPNQGSPSEQIALDIFRFIFDQQPRIRIKLKRGIVIYLICTDWFLMWIRYIQIYGCTEVVFENEFGEETRYCEDSLSQQLNQHWISRPPRINNMGLLGEHEEDLRMDMQIFRDFIPLPEDLWVALQQVYGGGPQIRRIYPELHPMIIYKVSLDSHCNFKPQIRRKMHLQSSPIQRVFDPQQRIKDPQSKIYVKKIDDQQWTELQKDMILMNRKLNHGFVVKVPTKLQQKFLQQYSNEESTMLHYGSLMMIRNVLEEEEMVRVVMMDMRTVVVHYVGRSWRCDTEFRKKELYRAIEDPMYIPLPKYQVFGLPPEFADYNCNRYICPVLECLFATPYFSWYLQRKKYLTSLGPKFRNSKRSIVHILSVLGEKYKMKDSYGTCLDEISKLTSEFNNRVERYQGRSFVTTEKVFPNQFLDDLLKVMAEELSNQECLLESRPGQGASCLADQSFPIIPKFFSCSQYLKTVCQQCKSQQSHLSNTYILTLPVSQDDQILFQAIFRSKKLQFTKYAIRIRRSDKFKQYVSKFSSTIKVPNSQLAFAEIYEKQFRKHFGQSDYESTLQLLGLNETDKIFIFEMDEEVGGTDMRGSAMRAAQRSIPSRNELKPEIYVDFNVYNDWQVGKIKSMERDKATIISYDGEAEVEYRRIRYFKDRTKEKPLFRIDVLHRKYCKNSHKIEYFLVPSIINVAEWMTWDEISPIIQKQAKYFVINCD